MNDVIDFEMLIYHSRHVASAVEESFHLLLLFFLPTWNTYMINMTSFCSLSVHTSQIICKIMSLCFAVLLLRWSTCWEKKPLNSSFLLLWFFTSMLQCETFCIHSLFVGSILALCLKKYRSVVNCELSLFFWGICYLHNLWIYHPIKSRISNGVHWQVWILFEQSKTQSQL